MRTPSPGAIDVVSRFPQGRLLVVPGVGHSVLGADVSFCAQRGRARLDARHPAAGELRATEADRRRSCPPTPQRSDRRTEEERRPLRTLAIVSQSLRDAAGDLGDASNPGSRIAGVSGGKLTASAQGFTLVRYSVTPGVELSGKLRIGNSGLPAQFSGRRDGRRRCGRERAPRRLRRQAGGDARRADRPRLSRSQATFREKLLRDLSALACSARSSPCIRLPFAVFGMFQRTDGDPVDEARSAHLARLLPAILART